MKKEELLTVLEPVVAEYRLQSYAYWLPYVVSSDPIVFYRTASDGAQCCIEISAFWDDQPDADIRVAFAIDDGGWRQMFPTGADFIIASDGSFVGE